MKVFQVPMKSELNVSSPHPVVYGSSQYYNVIRDIGESAQRSQSVGENPFHAIDLVRKSGLGALRVPREEGGSGATLREMFSMIIDLAEVAPDIPHILRSHYWFVEDRLRSNNVTEKTRWLQKVVEGNIFGNAVTEIGNDAAIGSWVLQTTLKQVENGYVLNGKKYYVTGSLFSDWVSVQAANSEGEIVASVIPVDREGVTLKDDWDGIGQKMTGSGTGLFENVYVKEAEILRESSALNSGAEEDELANTYFVGQLVQLILTAIIAGIMKSIATDTASLIRGRSRTYSHAPAEKPADDPILHEIAGRISSGAFAAEAAVLSAAESQDKARISFAGGNLDFELIHEATVRAAQAKVVIDELAQKAATLIFDVGGASAVKQSEELDRHWRNVRTLASHNPTPYKAQSIGSYLVKGERLPANGYF